MMVIRRDWKFGLNFPTERNLKKNYRAFFSVDFQSWSRFGLCECDSVEKLADNL